MGVVPDVSVVIPAYRAQAWIGRALRSVAEQVGVSTEVIIVEDGVFDDTRGIVGEFSNARLITLQENRGAQVARNAGLGEARGEFVMFLDADDYLEGQVLAGLVDALRTSRSGIAFAPWRRVWEDGRGSEKFQPQALEPLERVGDWLTGGWHPPCSVLWRRSTVVAIGGWKVGMKKNQDGEIVIRCLLQGYQSAISTEGAGVYWQHVSEHRVTSASMADSLPSQEVVRQLVEAWMHENHAQASRLKDALAIFCYNQSKAAFFFGEQAQGDAWLSHARRYGLRRHPGNLLHRVSATVLGLARKQQLLARIYASAPFIKTGMGGR